jgi:hypothetical protein
MATVGIDATVVAEQTAEGACVPGQQIASALSQRTAELGIRLLCMFSNTLCRLLLACDEVVNILGGVDHHVVLPL